MAHYQVSGVTGFLTRVTKTIGGLSSSTQVSDDSNPAKLIKTIPQGKIEITIDTNHGTIHDLDGASHEDTLVRGHVLAAQNTSVAAHILSSARLSEKDLTANLRMLTVPRSAENALTSFEGALTSTQEKVMQQLVLGTDSLQSMLDALSEIDKGPVSPNRQTNVYLKLKAIISLNPKASETLGQHILNANSASPSTDLIITALSAVGTSEAQDALCAVARAKKNDSSARIRLVAALGSLRRPAEGVVQLLYEFSHSSSRDIRSVSLLALGGAAKNLANVSGKRSTAIVIDLADRWSVSKDIDEKTTLLLALGNSASKRSEDILLKERTGQSPELRRTAVTALADFQSPKSIRGICDSLNVDSDVRVRSAAAQSLAPHIQVTAVRDALLRAVQRDDAESVRLASMFALTDLIPRDDHVREVIGVIAKEDSSATVKGQANSLLQKAGGARKTN